jgi:hypothetical protein
MQPQRIGPQLLVAKRVETKDVAAVQLLSASGTAKAGDDQEQRENEQGRGGADYSHHTLPLRRIRAQHSRISVSAEAQSATRDTQVNACFSVARCTPRT